jgi:hypothetical protein
MNPASNSTIQPRTISLTKALNREERQKGNIHFDGLSHEVEVEPVTVGIVNDLSESISWAHKVLHIGIANQEGMNYLDSSTLPKVMNAMTMEANEALSKSEGKIEKLIAECKVAAAWGIGNCWEMSNLVLLHYMSRMPRGVEALRIVHPIMDHTIPVVASEEAMKSGDQNNIVLGDGWKIFGTPQTLASMEPDEAFSNPKKYSLSAGSHSQATSQFVTLRYTHNELDAERLRTAVEEIDRINTPKRIDSADLDRFPESKSVSRLNKIYNDKWNISSERSVVRFRGGNDFADVDKISLATYFERKFNFLARSNDIPYPQMGMDFDHTLTQIRNGDAGAVSQFFSMLDCNDATDFILDLIMLGLPTVEERTAAVETFCNWSLSKIDDPRLSIHSIRRTACLLQKTAADSAINTELHMPVLRCVTEAARRTIPVHEGVLSESDVKDIITLICKGFDFDISDSVIHGINKIGELSNVIDPLISSIKSGNTAAVRNLLSLTPISNIKKPLRQAIESAISKNHHQMVELLLQWPETGLLESARWSEKIMRQATLEDRFEVVEMLLQHPDTAVGDIEDALEVCIKKGSASMAELLLQDSRVEKSPSLFYYCQNNEAMRSVLEKYISPPQK